MKDGKPTGGYDRLKIKYAELQEKFNKLDKQHTESAKHAIALHERAEDQQKIIEQQGSRISELTAELANAKSDINEYKRQRDKAVECMGPMRRLWYGFNTPEFNEDEGCVTNEKIMTKHGS